MVKLICKRCKYTWETKSKRWFVTCPSCQVKVRVPNGKTNKVQGMWKRSRIFSYNPQSVTTKRK